MLPKHEGGGITNHLLLWCLRLEDWDPVVSLFNLKRVLGASIKDELWVCMGIATHKSSKKFISIIPPIFWVELEEQNNRAFDSSSRLFYGIIDYRFRKSLYFA